jgi:hypothetical protein
MRLMGKQLSNVTHGDLEELADLGVAESETLEFKAELPSGGADDRREFLRDVSAFANRAGGVILYGVSEESSEEGGVAAEVPGLPNLGDFDERRLQLEQVLRTGLQPSLTNVLIRKIERSDLAPVVAVGVPKSLLAPHGLWYGNTRGFYRRAGGGRYQVEVFELRRLFLESESWEAEARRFRKKRIAEVMNGKVGPTVDASLAAAFVHVVPLGRLHNRIDLSSVDFNFQTAIRPPRASSWGERVNLDGHVVLNEHQTPLLGYALYFRHGGAEIYAALDDNFYTEVEGAGEKAVDGSALERDLADHIDTIVQGWLPAANISPPIAIFISLLGVRGRYLIDCLSGRMPSRRHRRPIDRDRLLLPAVVVDDLTTFGSEDLGPLFDAMWQASGWEKSPIPEL